MSLVPSGPQIDSSLWKKHKAEFTFTETVPPRDGDTIMLRCCCGEAITLKLHIQPAYRFLPPAAPPRKGLLRWLGLR